MEGLNAARREIRDLVRARTRLAGEFAGLEAAVAVASQDAGLIRARMIEIRSVLHDIAVRTAELEADLERCVLDHPVAAVWPQVQVQRAASAG